MEIRSALRVNVRSPTRWMVLGPIWNLATDLIRGCQRYPLWIDGVSEQTSINFQVLDGHPGDGRVRVRRFGAKETETYRVDLEYLLERAGVVGLSEVFMSDISLGWYGDG